MMKRRFSSKANRRTNPRRASFIIANYQVKEGRFRDIVKNVGSSGMFIGTRRAIGEGQPIVATFPLFDFDQPIQVSGTVTRSGPNGFAVVFDTPIADLQCPDGHFPDIVHEIDR